MTILQKKKKEKEEKERGKERDRKEKHQMISRFVCSVSQETDFGLHLAGSLAFWLPGLDLPRESHQQSRSEVRRMESQGIIPLPLTSAQLWQLWHSTTTASRFYRVTPFLNLHFSFMVQEHHPLPLYPSAPGKIMVGHPSVVSGRAPQHPLSVPWPCPHLSTVPSLKPLQNPSWTCHLLPPNWYPFLLSWVSNRVATDKQVQEILGNFHFLISSLD